MKPIITIPCYGRPEAKIFSKLEHIRLQKYVFIRESQLSDFEYLKDKGYTLVTLPTSIYEIGMTRKYIVHWCSKHNYEWAFMFDDDISKVELLGKKDDDSWNSQRIIEGSKTPPRFENRALRLWFDLAQKYELSLSSPNHRAYDRFNHGQVIRVNKSTPIQCVLLHIPSVILVGNYANSRKIGNEDLYIIYKLMSAGFRTAKIGLVEYDCPAMGNIEDGTADTMITKYKRFVECFKENVCDDPDLIGIKTTSTGVPSIQFKWKNWGGYDIKLEEDNE